MVAAQTIVCRPMSVIAKKSIYWSNIGSRNLTLDSLRPAAFADVDTNETAVCILPLHSFYLTPT